MRASHNAGRKSHWTGVCRIRNLDSYGAAMPWKSDVIEAGQRKPVQSEGLHSIALEPHYSVPQVAAMWHVSEKTVRRLFDGEAGVLRWGSSETARKRGYQNLRIPQSVLIRVHHRRQTA
jgi:hypothetical protein